MNAIFPIRRFTVDEVMRMVQAGLLEDEERLELIDGALVTMSPQNPPHVTATDNVAERLGSTYGSTFYVRRHSPVVASPHDLPEPDVALVAGSLQDYRRRHPRADETILLVEVSHATQRRDRAKATIYARGNAPVYWILDLEARTLTVHEDPRDDGYANVVELGPDDLVTLPHLDVTWRVGDLLP